jgi:hypothetical protein
MKSSLTCEIFGCLETKVPNAVVTVDIDGTTHNYQVCAEHQRFLKEGDPALYHIGLTYLGEPEIRVRPAFPTPAVVVESMTDFPEDPQVLTADFDGDTVVEGDTE